MPIERLEHEPLPMWFSRDCFISGRPMRDGVVPGERFGLVVEIDQEGFLEAGFDEAVCVAVERRGERAIVEEGLEVLDEDLPSK